MLCAKNLITWWAGSESVRMCLGHGCTTVSVRTHNNGMEGDELLGVTRLLQVPIHQQIYVGATQRHRRRSKTSTKYRTQKRITPRVNAVTHFFGLCNMPRRKIMCAVTCNMPRRKIMHTNDTRNYLHIWWLGSLCTLWRWWDDRRLTATAINKVYR